jgi:hypothetical protein
MNTKEIGKFLKTEDSNINIHKIIVKESIVDILSKNDLSDENKFILFIRIYQEDKQKTSLNITNFFNFQITSTGKLKNLNTKAWGKSRERLENIDSLIKESAKKFIYNLEKGKDDNNRN